MTTIKPRTMPGVMELLPLEQIAFQDMLERIGCAYARFGFLPIETPAIELSEVLLTKTGGETERQVYFVQSTGSLKQGETPDLALRFDLTIPLARYVAAHERELVFPFRRQQLQRVYRGESAQKGRFREFYQCDIDIVGKDALSIRYDAEIPAVIYHVFKELAIGPFTIRLNNRKLIRGFFAGLGIADGERQMLILREVDKLDKKGATQVREALLGTGFELPASVADRILAFAEFRSTGHNAALQQLATLKRDYPEAAAGADEMVEVLELMKALGVPESHYALDFSIARGLDYYTGTIYETVLNDYPQIGSICSGGRYEDLASHYTRSRLPGVGISIGATRLFYQLQEAGLIKPAHSTTQVLLAPMSDELLARSLALASTLREASINVEMPLEAKKLAKQFQYADRMGIRFVAVIGEEEAARSMLALKDLRTQQQRTVTPAEAITIIQNPDARA